MLLEHFLFDGFEKLIGGLVQQLGFALRFLSGGVSHDGIIGRNPTKFNRKLTTKGNSARVGVSHEGPLNAEHLRRPLMVIPPLEEQHGQTGARQPAPVFLVGAPQS